jgi:large subunit ribosomal protein L9
VPERRQLENEEDSRVKVVLKKSIDSLGNVGDVVTVADGYARNYLIPRDLATRADEGKIKLIEHERRVIRAREEKAIKETQGLARRIEEISCTISARAGEEDRLFGSVTGADIALAMDEAGVRIDKKQVQLEEPIKELGVYSVPIDLGRGITARLKLWVVRE